MPQFETWGVSLEQKVGSGTYLGAAFDWLESEELRSLGAFDVFVLDPIPTQTRVQRDYRERTLSVTANQLLSRDWSLGVSHRYTRDDPEFGPGGNLLGTRLYLRGNTSIVCLELNSD